MVKILETEEMSQKAFNSLLDYSCSIPTGKIIGKVWKRRIDYYDETKGWLIGEYIYNKDAEYVDISWRKIKIV